MVTFAEPVPIADLSPAETLPVRIASTSVADAQLKSTFTTIVSPGPIEPASIPIWTPPGGTWKLISPSFDATMYVPALAVELVTVIVPRVCGQGVSPTK